MRGNHRILQRPIWASVRIVGAYGKRQFKLGSRHTQVVPVVFWISRQSLHLEWAGQFHEGWPTHNHNDVASKADCAFSRPIVGGQGIEPGKHDPNTPLEPLQAAFKEDRQPG